MQTTPTTPQKKRLRKRYIAIAALASLVAASGVVGALVTNSSTIAGNTLTYEQAEATVVVTGDGFKAPINLATPPAFGGSNEIVDGVASSMDLTVENRGQGAATVNVRDLGKLWTIFPSSYAPQIQGYLVNEDDSLGNEFFYQSDGNSATTAPFSLEPNESRKVRFELRMSTNHWTQLTTESLSAMFDIPFQYKTSRSDYKVTPESTITGNQFTFIWSEALHVTGDPLAAKVDLDQTPVFDKNSVIPLNGATMVAAIASTEWTATNTGPVPLKVTVPMQKTPVWPGAGLTEMAIYAVDDAGARTLVFSRGLNWDDSQTNRHAFTVPANASQKIVMEINADKTAWDAYKAGTTTPELTVAFNYIRG